MSTLSDVQALYGNVRDMWARSQTHVFAHVVLACVILLCGASNPEIPIPQVDPKRVSEDEWFKLTKDIGIIYASFVIPIVIIAAYAAVLQAAGRFLVGMVMLTFPPLGPSDGHRLLSAWSLEPLALALRKTDFNFGELQLKASEVALKYQLRKDTHWDDYQKAIGQLTKNSQVYLGDFLFFLLVWVALFKFVPHAPWIQANAACFLPVAIILFGLSLFGWFRVSRAVAMMPSLQLFYTAAALRTDPDMKALLDASEEDREKIRKRLEEILNEREHADLQPSLLAFVRYKLGLRPRALENTRRILGLPFPGLYEAGSDFAWSAKAQEAYDKDWLAGYLAYLYYRLHRRVTRVLRGLWHLARYVVTGIP
jgi:hypothetical protein